MAGLFLTNLPAQIIQWALQAQGHEAQGFSLQGPSFFHRTLGIERLQIDDETRTLEIENLKLEVDHQHLLNLHIGKAYFRDKTKPNMSLRKLLLSLKSASDTTPTCLDKLQIDHLSLALSFSSKPLSIGPLLAKNICLGSDLRFEALSVDSKDLIQTDRDISWLVSHDHFYDVPAGETVPISFVRGPNFIALLPQNSPDILHHLTDF